MLKYYLRKMSYIPHFFSSSRIITFVLYMFSMTVLFSEETGVEAPYGFVALEDSSLQLGQRPE